MTRPRDDPARRCLPVRDWPARERSAWERALAPSPDVLSADGAAAHWRPTTRRLIENAYGRWLTFLDRRDDLDRAEDAGARATEERLRAYIAELSEQIASTTLAGRIRDLSVALSVLAPDHDQGSLLRARQRLKVRACPERDKRAPLAGPAELLELAATLLERAGDPSGGRADWRACCYRDALTLMVLVFRPLRRRNLVGLVLGRTLFDEGDVFRIAFDGSAMKNRRDYAARLPAVVTPYIREYLATYRPILLRGTASDHLWISSRGHPLDDASLYGKIVQHTRAAFGKPLSPHLFRDAAATFLGEENPALVQLAASLLHHADGRSTEAHYNHARAHHAVRDYQRTVLTLRHGDGGT
ncbi:tyrosine-type recombinase/integrase [Thalassobaculum sp.]|uniref:tyrosine-type recombinase/integrase n=1 Tax=Thalassobaculum sp. TaxID=2022740 RepID=UPI0032EF1042